VIPFWAPAFAGVSGVELEVWVSWPRTGMFAGSHLRPRYRSSRRRPGSRLRGLGSAWRAGCEPVLGPGLRRGERGGVGGLGFV